MKIEEHVLHRDGLILVLNKPSGLPVHGGPKAAGFAGPVLSDYLEELRFGFPTSPQLAHRLDRDTSGCIILGRHRKSLNALEKLFKARLIKKTYYAWLQGELHEKSGEITAKLAKRDENRGWWMKVSEEGEEAITRFTLLKTKEGRSFVELNPLTGRTHQLRVHMLHLGFPIVGDKIYGGEPRFSQNRLLLHAGKINIPHNLKPHSTSPSLEISAPLPNEFEV